MSVFLPFVLWQMAGLSCHLKYHLTHMLMQIVWAHSKFIVILYTLTTWWSLFYVVVYIIMRGQNSCSFSMSHSLAGQAPPLKKKEETQYKYWRGQGSYFEVQDTKRLSWTKRPRRSQCCISLHFGKADEVQSRANIYKLRFIHRLLWISLIL